MSYTGSRRRRHALGQTPTPVATVATPAQAVTVQPHIRLMDVPMLLFMGTVGSYGASLLVPTVAGALASKQHRVRNGLIGLGFGLVVTAALPVVMPSRFAFSMRG